MGGWWICISRERRVRLVSAVLLLITIIGLASDVAFAARSVVLRRRAVVLLDARIGAHRLYCRVQRGQPRQVGRVKVEGQVLRFTPMRLRRQWSAEKQAIFQNARVACQQFVRVRFAPTPTATPTTRGTIRPPTLTATPTFAATPTHIPPPTPSSTPTPVPCNPMLAGGSATAIENSDVVFPLSSSVGCGSVTLSYELTTLPQHGSVSFRGNSATYHGSFFDGEDSFFVRVCVPSRSECSPPARFSVEVQAGNLTGRRYSLEAYKENVSEYEVRYLLNKVAFGGCPRLVEFGVQHGLSALVDRLLDESVDACQHALPLYPGGYVGDHSAPNNTSADALAYWMAHPRHWGNSVGHWTPTLLYRSVFVNLRYGMPLREYLWSMVWDPQFATDVLRSENGGMHDAKLHYNTLSTNALGHFEDFFRDFYGPLMLSPSPGLSRVPGVDPALAFNPDRTSPSGVEIYPLSGEYRAYGQKHFQRFLNNETNAEPLARLPNQRLNENLGRESLELHTLGVFDLVSGTRNYDESEVLSSTRALSGLALDFDGNHNADGDYETRLTLRPSDDAGPTRYFLSFFPFRSAGARGIASTLFDGTPQSRTAAWQSHDWSLSGESSNIFSFLLRQHDAASRRLVARLVATLVGPDLLEDRAEAERVVSTLAAAFRVVEERQSPVRGAYRTSLDIKRPLRVILRSQMMFARRRGGYSSPLENLLSALRVADIRVTNQHIPDLLVAELRSAGHLPLNAPSVFAWPSSGTPSTGYFHDGSAWLDTTPLLATHRATLRMLNVIFLPTSGPQRMGEVIFPHGIATCHYTTTPNNGAGCPTAEAVVEHVLRLFNLDGTDGNGELLVGAAERQVLIEYLDRPTSPWPRVDLWRASVQEGTGLAVQRGIGLLYLVSTLPDRFVKR